MHLSVDVCVNVYVGKEHGTRKKRSWNVVCVRYHATFIHIEFSRLACGNGGRGWWIRWGRGMKWLYSLCFDVVWNFYAKVKLADVVLEILEDLLIVT